MFKLYSNQEEAQKPLNIEEHIDEYFYKLWEDDRN